MRNLQNKLASQSCAVAKSETFCWAARQLILKDRMEDFSTSQRKPNLDPFLDFNDQPFVGNE